MIKLNLLRVAAVTLSLFLFLFHANAQQRLISGVVINAEGNGVPSATVQITETNETAVTGDDGKFSIKAGIGQHLEISSVGYVKNAIIVKKGNDIRITLEKAGGELGEVVVTALGISRQKRALGYAVQEISGDAVKNTAETNIVNALAGKAAGVFVNSSSGNVGASSRIIIRGNQSLKGENQPLFVVDGIPIDNSIQSSTRGNYDFTDMGNGAADINSSDIANVTILKGGNASALYGSRGANGVILITTKTGKGKGYSLSLENSVTYAKPLLLPTFQNEYGQGGSQQYWYKNGLNGGKYDGVDESFGPRLDYRVQAADIVPGGKLYWAVQAGFPQTVGEILQLPQFDSPIDATGKRIPTPWISHPDNVKNFYETGVTRITNVALSNGGAWGNIRLSLTNSDQGGMVPNTWQKKNTINFSGSTNITEKLSFNTKVTYTNTNSNLNGSGYTFNNVGMQTIWTGRQVDWEYEKNHIENPDGTENAWISVFHDNPYWLQYKNSNPETENRIIGTASIKYQFNNWLSFIARTGIDYSNQQLELIRAYYSTNDLQGRYQVSNFFRQEMNSDFLFSAMKNIMKDLSFSANVGGNIMNRKYRSQSSFVGKLVVPNNYSLANAGEIPTTTYYKSEKEIQSLYTAISLGYKNQLYLDVTGRNDWSSTLPVNKNSYFYPSASTSWIFSNAFKTAGSFFSFGKLRLGIAQTGSDTDPYQLNTTYNAATPYGSAASFSINSQMPPTNLVNELATSSEVGMEVKLFKNRLGIDATLYKTVAKNQILSATVSPTSGFNSQLINAGQVNNSGIELMLSGTPIQSDKFTWDVTLNWSKNTNKIIALNGDIKTLSLYQAEGNTITVVADVGGSYGDMMGKGFVYDNKSGKPIVDQNGVPLTSDTRKLGNIMPDWLGSINNSFSYGNFNFNFLIDVKWGGDVYSRTNQDGWATGALTSTVGLNANGVSIRDPLNVGGGYLFDGVFADGKPNNIYKYLDDFRWNAFARSERWLYDASYVKLRQVALSYSIPKTVFKKVGLSQVDLSIFARNLAILYTKAKNFDPEVANRGASQSSQGSEYAAPPSARNIGFRVKITF